MARPLCLAVHQDDEAWQLHERLGHANFGSLEKMSKLDMVPGLPPISYADQFYDVCWPSIAVACSRNRASIVRTRHWGAGA